MLQAIGSGISSALSALTGDGSRDVETTFDDGSGNVIAKRVYLHPYHDRVEFKLDAEPPKAPSFAHVKDGGSTGAGGALRPTVAPLARPCTWACAPFSPRRTRRTVVRSALTRTARTAKSAARRSWTFQFR